MSWKPTLSAALCAALLVSCAAAGKTPQEAPAQAPDDRAEPSITREFAPPNVETPAEDDGVRDDFRETVYWNPAVRTDENGEAKVTFRLSEAVTSFRATGEGVSDNGAPSRGEGLIVSRLPVSIALKLPLEVSRGDIIELPIQVSNETSTGLVAELSGDFGGALTLTQTLPATLKVRAGKSATATAHLRVEEGADGTVDIAIRARGRTDRIRKQIKVVPRGFPQELSVAGKLSGKTVHLVDLKDANPGTIDASIKLYATPLSTMVAGLDGMIRSPGGCFEQASSSNYPNVMILQYMNEFGAADEALRDRAGAQLDSGYGILTGYETSQKGYEWFGREPAHEALSAYGLMEFSDMAALGYAVDPELIPNVVSWLKSRRDGDGGYERSSSALDSFGRASPDVTNAYITYAMVEAGERDIPREIAQSRELASSTRDPYILSLTAGTMIRVAPEAKDTRAAVVRLSKMQAEDGAFRGADQTITMSGGNALDIETTALATLTLLAAGPEYVPNAQRAVDWMQGQRSAWGNFYSTQATVLSLKALTAFAKASRSVPIKGRVIVHVRDTPVASYSVDQDLSEPLTLEGLGAHLKPGKNTVTIELEGEGTVPYAATFTWNTDQPADSPEAKVGIETKLSRERLPWGEGATASVTLRNLTDEGLPMVLGRVGLPGGLTFQTWQLDELKSKGVIDFYETREREVILYLTQMKPRQVVEAKLELIARVPGHYEAPASSAYLYYTDEYKRWAAPMHAVVEGKQ